MSQSGIRYDGQIFSVQFAQRAVCTVTHYPDMLVRCFRQIVCWGGQYRFCPGFIEIGVDEVYFFFTITCWVYISSLLGYVFLIPVCHQESALLSGTPDMVRSKNIISAASGQDGQGETGYVGPVYFHDHYFLAFND